MCFIIEYIPNRRTLVKEVKIYTSDVKGIFSKLCFDFIHLKLCFSLALDIYSLWHHCTCASVRQVHISVRTLDTAFWS